MKTFLFDLDGTLLAMDSQDFMHAYFGELTRALYGLLPTEGLARNILAATARMQADTSPGSSNLVKFRREFEALYQGIDQQAVWDRIMEFYATTFDNIRDVVGRNEPVYRSVVYLRQRGHRVLLTTNPVFPQLATYKRLAWAGFSPDAFEYVSTLENCDYCKPHVEYWHHVAAVMKVDPAQAVAVGNDCIEDVSAGLAGIETYLVTDYVIGDVASSGADHISDALGFERWILENY
ncbi:MAG: HAD family hydrolase [Patescibacteria group bacterium]